MTASSEQSRADVETLTVALSRGRVLEQLTPVLEATGNGPVEPFVDTRKLVFESVNPALRFLIVRGSDVPTYVEHGAADVGVTGKDVLLEKPSAGFYERLDLGIARCRIMTAARRGAAPPEGRPLRVATKYVNVAREYFARQHRQVDIIELSGAMEIAPVLGLCDQIVDIVETGSTLAANGLEALETIAEISTRVIVNRASMRTKFDQVVRLLDDMAQVRNEAG